MLELSTGEARRIALAAQGFTDRPHSAPTMRTLQRAVRRTGVLQVDSVNVLQRAHYMPLYSRMGPYDVDLLRRASEGPAERRRLVEYWAHVQALMPVELWPLMRHRMEFHRARGGKWWTDVGTDVARRVLAAVGQRGASTARELDGEGPRTRQHWGWNWSEVRKAMDHLSVCGELAVAGRTGSFEIRYDLPERVLPARILEQPAPTEAGAARELVRRAAVSHGVATAHCLGDYYRLGGGSTTGVGVARRAVEELVAEGELLPVRVQGWDRPAYLHRDARSPRRIPARTLLSPFDPVVWERARTEALFGFRYRIEIYTPPARRVHGYYVLPFLLGDRLVARVDLKADRRQRRLLVAAAYAEAGAPGGTAYQLAAELHRLAGWLALDHIEVADRGDLAAALAAEVPRAG